MNAWTFVKLIFLLALISAQAALLANHEYFRLTDIRISGLDTYASARARDATHDALSKTILFFPRNTYVSISTSHIQKKIQAQLALDSIQVEKRFPHTIVVEASERQPLMQLIAKNGAADIGDHGDIIRWYPAGTTNERLGQAPRFEIPEMLQSTELGSVAVAPELFSAVQAGTAAAAKLGSATLVSARDTGAGEAELSLMYSNKLEVILRTRANVETQIAKAIVSYKKYPQAKKIDVRFSDKVFVSF